MPKYDAFGREIGEDTLGEWRDGSGAAAEAGPVVTPEPATTPEPAVTAYAPPPASPPRFAPPRRRRRRGRLATPFIVLIGLIVFGANALSGIDFDFDSAIDDAVRGIEVDPPALVTPDAPSAPPTGLRGDSMIRADNLGAALKELEAKRLGRVYTLRLAPERIDAQMLGKTKSRSVQLTYDGTFRDFSHSGVGADQGGFRIAKLDPAAPQRLVRAAAKRINRPPAEINYLVALGEGTWTAYFKGGQYFQGDAKGRVVRRIS